MDRYLDFLRYRRRAIAIPALSILALAVLIAFLMPAVYRSTTTVLIEAQEIPQDFVRTTVTSYVEERIQTITQQVMSRPKLLEIINRFNLYRDMQRRKTTEEIIDQMRNDIKLEMISANVPMAATGRAETVTVAFQLSYEGKDPATVQEVANQLASLYLEQNLKTRGEQAATTTTFLEEERSALKQHIDELEAKIAAFKHQNLQALPEFQQVNLTEIIRMESDAEALKQQVRQLEERKSYLGGQLATLNPATPIISSTGERVVSPQDELEAVRTNYLSLRATLSDKHPDVIKAKKQIDELERQVGHQDSAEEMRKRLTDMKTDLANIRGKFSPRHPEVVAQEKKVAALEAEIGRLSGQARLPLGRERKPDNPAYITLQAELKSAEIELSSLKNQLRDTQARLRGREASLAGSPSVEKEYLDLRRDQETAQARFNELTNKLMSAQVAQGLEEKQKGEKFTIIDPAQLPEKPARPNRPAIALVGLILGLGSGIGLAAVIEHTDSSVRDAPMLAKLSGYPVLAAVPVIETEADRRLVRRRRRTWAIAAVAALIIALAVVNFVFMPLDIVWLKLLGRVG